jgi:uncharacterized protein YndB with AHSA1/START domain
MESTTEHLTLQRELEIAAAPETVWEFLVDPVKVASWWGMNVELDARPGGAYRIELIPGHIVRGAFVELDPPHRLVYSFGWEAGGGGPDTVPPGSSTVEIELSPSATGTTLRLWHRNLPGAESAGSHGRGWDHYFGRLEVAAAGGDPGPDAWLE